MLEVDVRRSDYSDETLSRRVSNYLSTRHFPEFRELLVDASNGNVTLTGTLTSHYQKQVALTSCRRVAGVLCMVDRIKVCSTN